MVLPPLKLLLIVFAICLSGSFHFGYLVIIPNPATVAFQNFLNDSFFNHHGLYLYESEFSYMWPLFLNLMMFGGFFGSLMLKPLAEKLGRNRSFYVVAFLQALGSLASALSYFTNSWELLSIGRLISGVSVGLSLGLQPIYFSEISPKSVLGVLNGMTGITLQLGLVIGSVLALPSVFGSEYMWHYIFWFEFLTSFVTLAVLPFIPESPKYLLAANDDWDQARESLIFFQHKDVEDDMKEIEEEIISEKETIGLKTIWKTPYLRQGLLIGSLTMVACQCSGIGAISFFSTYLFEKSGVPTEVAPYATVAMSFITVIAAIISSFIVDRVGRRPLILVSLISLAALHSLFMLFTYISNQTDDVWPGYVCVIDTIIFMFMFGIGPAILAWFVIAEIMPQNARSTAMSFAQALQWICTSVSNTVFYLLEEQVNEWSFFLFIVPLVAIFIYLYFKFPETKNKTTLEIISNLGYSNEQDSKCELENNGEVKNLFFARVEA